jgi:hypothetical protein
MIILDMGLEMFGQIGDSLGQDRHLDFRRAGIAGLQSIFFHKHLLAFGGNRHRINLSNMGNAKNPSAKPDRDVVQQGSRGWGRSANFMRCVLIHESFGKESGGILG